MAHPAFELIFKLARKLIMALVVATLALLTHALWMYVRERGDYEEHRSGRIALVEAQAAEAGARLAEAVAKTDAAKAELAAQKQRAAQVEKLLTNLHAMDPGALDRLVGDREAQALHAGNVERAEKMKTATTTRIVELQREVVDGEGRVALLSAAHKVLVDEQASLRDENHAAFHYLRLSWNEGRWLVYGVFFGYLFGGLAVALALYYGWAPLAAKGRPLQFRANEVPLPVVVESALGVEHSLWPGERLWVRRRFLQTADDALTRGKRLVPDWRRPLSWWLAGARRLQELRNERSDGERTVVIADRENPFAELTVVSVPEGGAFVVRASRVVGMIADINSKPAVIRHWRWRSWHSWVAGQFGYWEFCGRCRLVILCHGPVQAKTLKASGDAKPASNRETLADLLGFTPQLSLHPVRTQGFWRYCRGGAALFDLQVSGNGLYVLREMAGRASDCLKARLLKRAGL